MQNAGMLSPHLNKNTNRGDSRGGKNTNRGDSRGGSGMREHRVSNKHVNDHEEEKLMHSPHAVHSLHPGISHKK